MYTVDIDVGGTLTDGLFSDGQSIRTVKVDTTPHDLTVCFMDCLAAGARQFGFDELTTFLPHVRLIRWSTTITSNVLAQRTGPKLGLFVSTGHEGDLYAHTGPSPALGTLVAEADVIGLTRPIEPKTVLQAVKELLENGVRRVCVSLSEAFQDPGDEQTVKRIIATQYPDHFLGAVPVLLGSDVSHYPDDRTRTHQALINAYVHGPLATSLYKAEDDLRALGYDRPLLIGHANGGVARVAKTKALDTLESGPTLGLFAAAYFARQYGLPQVVSLDVGGTTAKVGLIRDGRPVLTRNVDVFGIPLRAPAVLVRSIALGGGSVIRTDPGTHQLQLGPRSMGAYPGPACYDLGGTEPTLTDAFVTLGWLNPNYFLGGARPLNLGAAREALAEQVAKPLGVSVEEAAALAMDAAVQIVSAAIGAALDEVGWRPPECTLFAFGGNGPIFACGVADRADLPRAYVFELGAVLSAFGSARSDIVHVYEHGLNLTLASPAALQHLAAVLGWMRDEALRDMQGEGLDLAMVDLALELEPAEDGHAPIALAMPLDAAMRGDLRAVPEAYRTTPFTLARLRATYAMPGYEPPRRPLSPGDLAAALKERRTVVWGRITHLVPIYTWEALRPGQSVSGGAVLESMATTYPVPPGWILRVDEFGNGQLTRG